MLHWELGDSFDDWGYDELTDAGDGFFRHEILFASGGTIAIEFQHFKQSAVQQKEQRITTSLGGVTTMKYDDVVREFIDFVNLQVGVYMNSIAGFSGAKIQMERQAARVLRAQSRKKDARGDQVITHQSFEDPRSPDVIHSRVVTAENFIQENSEGGINQRQLSYSILVFIFTYWEDEIRPRLAEAAGVETKDVKSEIMGDLRCIRNSILHTKGVFTPEWHGKLVVLKDCFTVGQQIQISYELMHQIFVKIKQGCAKLTFGWLGVDPAGRFEIDQLKEFVIQKGRAEGDAHATMLNSCKPM